MHTRTLRWMRPGAVLLLACLLLGTGALGQAQPAAASAPGTPATGIICTSAGPNPTFTLVTQTGYIGLPDGNTMFMWGYALDGQPFQHPSPVLCVNEGDTVTVILRNTFAEAVSIMFPGQDNVTADGQPVAPQFDASVPPVLTSLTTAAPPGGSITYSFVASKPGAYIYESGTQAQKQVNMGLFGALIVRPAMGTSFAYNRADSQFTPEEEFLVLLSEIDPYQHQAVQQGRVFNMNNYHPRYWLINGRGFPDSIADNFASWLTTQPYGALARIHPYNTDPNAGAAYHPYPGIIHYINVGTDDFPFHPHGNNGVLIGRDGQPLEGAAGEDLSVEKFTVNIGPGQTWDLLFKWYDAEVYDEMMNPVTVAVPDPANMTFGMMFSGSPYLGMMGPMPPGMSTLNQCGEYYIISHNHALFQITSWGVTMSGPATYLRIDPPPGAPMAMQCPPFP